jgi:hypothetical protein
MPHARSPGVPFLPFVLLLAWQALSRGASFALGWATALYFGQVPGSKGRLLAVISLVSAAWVILVVGFAVPLVIGAVLDAARIVPRNFDVPPLHVAALAAAIVLVPPANAAGVVVQEFHGQPSVGRWLRLVPGSHPATASLGVAVLLMVAITPVLLVARLRRGWAVLQVPLVMRHGADDDDLRDALTSAVREVGIAEMTLERVDGIRAWPLVTAAFAARHLLGAAVRGEPLRLWSDDLELYAYATNVAILAPKELAHRARAAIARRLAFSDAYLTWSEDSQGLEDELMRVHATGAHPRAARQRLEELQREIDAASLDADEWNVLYRLRLQVELAARERSAPLD